MAMKEKTRQIFDYVKAHETEDITAGDVAEALGIDPRSVNGSFTSFVKKGWGVREEAEIELADKTHKKIKYLRMTDEGRTVDPDATE